MTQEYPRWSTTLVTAPTAEPVSLTEAKLHLKVEHVADDTLITSLIEAARHQIEAVTGRAIMTQTLDLRLDRFPRGEIRLVKPPVSAIALFTYVDTDGTTRTMASADYRADLPSGPLAQPGRIEPVYGGAWPSTRDVSNAVRVQLTCGYGSAALVPAPLKAAMFLLIGHWYETREAVNVNAGVTVQVVPLAVDALLGPFRVVTFQ